MSLIPTGRLLGNDLVLTRTFRAPVEDVWASITDPARTARWFGPWEGEAGVGRTVKVQMAHEEGRPWMDMVIDACEPPHRLAISAGGEPGGESGGGGEPEGGDESSGGGEPGDDGESKAGGGVEGGGESGGGGNSGAGDEPAGGDGSGSGDEPGGAGGSGDGGDGGFGGWHLELVLTEVGGVTELRFTQRLGGTAGVGEVGPGWEYYLDGLVAAREGRAMPDFGDYYPAMKDHFEAQR